MAKPVGPDLLASLADLLRAVQTMDPKAIPPILLVVPERAIAAVAALGQATPVVAWSGAVAEQLAAGTATRHGRQPLELYLLGPLRVVGDQRDVDLAASDSGRAGRRDLTKLLAFFVHHRGTWLPTDAITDAMWPQETATGRLNQRFRRALYSLRRLLAPWASGLRDQDVILHRGDAYRLNPDLPLWVDADHFDSLIRQAGLVERRQGAASSLDLYRHAVNLYRGKYLVDMALVDAPGDEFYQRNWWLQRQERLHAMAWDARMKLAEHCLRAGDDVQALTLAQDAISDPDLPPELIERAAWVLLSIHVRTGNWAEGILTYRQTTQKLGCEEAAPSARLRRLAVALTEQAPVVRMEK